MMEWKLTIYLMGVIIQHRCSKRVKNILKISTTLEKKSYKFKIIIQKLNSTLGLTTLNIKKYRRYSFCCRHGKQRKTLLSKISIIYRVFYNFTKRCKSDNNTFKKNSKYINSRTSILPINMTFMISDLCNLYSIKFFINCSKICAKLRRVKMNDKEERGTQPDGHTQNAFWPNTLQKSLLKKYNRFLCWSKKIIS